MFSQMHDKQSTILGQVHNWLIYSKLNKQLKHISS